MPRPMTPAMPAKLTLTMAPAISDTAIGRHRSIPMRTPSNNELVTDGANHNASRITGTTVPRPKKRSASGDAPARRAVAHRPEPTKTAAALPTAGGEPSLFWRTTSRTMAACTAFRGMAAIDTTLSRAATAPRKRAEVGGRPSQRKQNWPRLPRWRQ